MADEMSPVKSCPSIGNSCSPLALEDVFGILQIWGLCTQPAPTRQLHLQPLLAGGKSSEIRTEWGSVGAIVVFSHNIQCFPLFLVLVFSPFMRAGWGSFGTEHRWRSLEPWALLRRVQIKLEVDSDLGQARIYLGLEESLGIIQLNI